MTEIQFLTTEQVLNIHLHWINRHGGDPSVRDLGLLQSAMAMPQQAFGGQYLHAGLPEMAAAYFFHLICNHAFVDGNKRAGTFSAIVFLECNGHMLDVEDDVLERVALGVAAGQIDKDEVVAFFRVHVKPL